MSFPVIEFSESDFSYVTSRTQLPPVRKRKAEEQGSRPAKKIRSETEIIGRQVAPINNSINLSDCAYSTFSNRFTLNRIEEIYLSHVTITFTEFQALLSQSNVKKLSLEACCGEHIGQLPFTLRLNLEQCQFKNMSISILLLKKIASIAPQIEELKLINCSLLDHDESNNFARISAESLIIENSEFERGTLLKITTLCTKIADLYITDSPTLSSAEILQALRPITRGLELLDLSGSSLQALDLQTLVNLCGSKLKYLYINSKCISQDEMDLIVFPETLLDLENDVEDLTDNFNLLTFHEKD